MLPSRYVAKRHGHDAAHGFGQAIPFAQLHASAVPGHELFKALLHRPGQPVRATVGGPRQSRLGLFQRRIAGERIVKRGHAHHKVRPLAARISLAAISGVKMGERMALPPFIRVALTHTPRPKPWKIGRMASIVRPAHSLPPQAATCMPSAMKLRFESTMPLGAPEVPPEKRIAAGSSGPVRAWGWPMMLIHKRLPPDNAAIGRHLRYLAALGESEAHGLQRREIVGDARQDDFFDWHGRLDVRKAAVEGVERQHDARAGGVQILLKLWRSGERMHHGRYRAKLARGIERDDALRRSRHADEDAVAFGEPQRREPIGACDDLPHEVRVGPVVSMKSQAMASGVASAAAATAS